MLHRHGTSRVGCCFCTLQAAGSQQLPSRSARQLVLALVQAVQVQARYARWAQTRPRTERRLGRPGLYIVNMISVILPRMISLVQQAAIAVTGSRTRATAGKPGGGAGGGGVGGVGAR